MKMLVLTALWVCCLGAEHAAQAQTGREVSIGVFGVEVLVGSLSAAGGMMAAKLVPLEPAEMTGAVLAATLGAGTVGWLMGASGNWLLAIAGGFGGWFLSDFFGAGIFGTNITYRISMLTPWQLTSRDAMFITRAIGTAFGVTIGLNLYR